MKKFFMTSVLLISVSAFIFSGCSTSKAKQTEQPNVNNEQTSKQDTSQNNSNDTTPKLNSDNSNSESTNAQSGSSNETAVSSKNYSKYSGHWVTEENYKNHYAFGTGMTITVDEKGNITGSIGTASNNASHVANVQFKGTLQGNKFTYKFDNDGWDHSGTIEFEFNDNKILGTITLNPTDQMSIWGLQAGKLTFVKAAS